MSPRLLTGSMILVLERSFDVGFWPSIQMYSAVIFATDCDLLGRMREDSRNASGNGALRLEELAAGAADHDLILPRRFGAVHGGVGAAEEVVFLLVDRLRGVRVGAVLGDAERGRDDAAEVQRRHREATLAHVERRRRDGSAVLIALQDSSGRRRVGEVIHRIVAE